MSEGLTWHVKVQSNQKFYSRQSHTFLVYLLSDLLLQIPLRIPHPANYCSLLSSRPPPPFHGVTVDTWHLETTCSSPTKCYTNAGQKCTGLKEPTANQDWCVLERPHKDRNVLKWCIWDWLAQIILVFLVTLLAHWVYCWSRCKNRPLTYTAMETKRQFTLLIHNHTL